MGDLLKATCSCGYESESLLNGFGFLFSNDGKYNEMAYCDHCGCVQESDGRNDIPVCKNCKRSIRFYKWDISIMITPKNEFGFPETGYLDQRPHWHCPRCKEETLTFENAGIWD